MIAVFIYPINCHLNLTPAMYWKAFDKDPVPGGVVIATVTNPTVWAGVLHVIVESLTTTIFVAATPPNVTCDALVKFNPVIVTLVPPTIVPVFEETDDIVGAGTGEYTIRIIPGAPRPTLDASYRIGT